MVCLLCDKNVGRCGVVRHPEHSFHERCYENWIDPRGSQNYGYQECPARCGRRGPESPSLVKRVYSAADFLQMNPPLSILAAGIPLLAINAVASVEATPIVVAAAAAAAEIKGATTATIAALAVSTGALVKLVEALDAEGGIVATVTGITAAGIAAGAAVVAGSIAKEVVGRGNFISTAAAISSLIVASTFINGNGWILGSCLAALSTVSFYTAKRYFN